MDRASLEVEKAQNNNLLWLSMEAAMFSILSLFDWYQSPCPRAPPSCRRVARSSPLRTLSRVASFIASYAPSAKAEVYNDDEKSEAP